MNARSGVGNEIDKPFDDSNDPGRPTFFAIAREYANPDVVVLNEMDLNMSSFNYTMLSWGKAFGIDHPAYYDDDDNDNNDNNPVNSA